MFEIQSGTSADIAAASAFLEANGLSPDALEGSVSRERGALFTLASSRGRLVGFARGAQAREARGSGADISGRFHVNTVIVDAGLRGAGVGKGLVERLLSDAAAVGFTTAQLWVETGNAPALSLYRRFGFTPAGPVEEGRLGAIQLMCARL